MIKLKNGIYYKKYDDLLYVRNVDAKMDYLFNETVFDILEYYKNGIAKRGHINLLEYLEGIYQIDDIQTAEEGIRNLLIELKENGIIFDDEDKEKLNEYGLSENIREITDNICIQNNTLDYVCLELTYQCNERCIHCYLDGNHDCENKELTLQDYKDILDQAYQLGCFRVLLTGGEVTLRKDYLDIAEYAVSKGMLIDIYTNGLNFSFENLKKIIVLKPNSVSVSLYGGDAETHDCITKVKGSFDKSLRTAMMLKCAGVDTYIKSIALKQNYDSIKSLYEIGKVLNIPVAVSLVVGSKAIGASADDVRINDISCYQRLIEMAYYYETQSIGNEVLPNGKTIDSALCNAGKTGLSIDPYGNVYPCNAYKVELGNIKTVSLEKIWNHSEKLTKIQQLRFRDLGGKCGQCDDISFCPICIGFAENEKNLDSYCRDVCMIAKAKQLLI